MGLPYRLAIVALTGVILLSWETIGLLAQSLTSSLWPMLVFPFIGAGLFATGVIAVTMLETPAPPDLPARRIPSPPPPPSADPYKLCEFPPPPEPARIAGHAFTESAVDLFVGLTCFATAAVAVLATSFMLNSSASLFMRNLVWGGTTISFSRQNGAAQQFIPETSGPVVTLANARLAGDPVVEYTSSFSRFCATPVVAHSRTIAADTPAKVWARCAIKINQHCEAEAVGDSCKTNQSIASGLRASRSEASNLFHELQRRGFAGTSVQALITVQDPASALYWSKLGLLSFLLNCLWLFPTVAVLLATRWMEAKETRRARAEAVWIEQPILF
jgi:hypothetical protein